MKKRIISMLMVMVMLLAIIGSSGCGTASETESAADETESTVEEAKLSKQEWVIGLGSTFGMDEYSTAEPFFSDVDSTAELYPYLQSCVEWGVLEEESGNFNPDSDVTREYAVVSAVLSAEVLGDSDGESQHDEGIAYAVNKGIIVSDDSSYLEESITYTEGQEILEWALNEYQNREFEEYSNVELVDTVIDLTDSGIETVTTTDDGSELYVPAEAAVELEVGDVFISPGDSASPDGYARKVTAISTDENGNQTIETTEPELEEIYEQMDFATRAVPDVSDVIVYDGVTVSSVENSSDVVYASAQMNSRDGSYSSGSNIATSKGANFEFKFNFQTGIPSIKAGWTSEYETLKADLTRWKSKDEEKIGQLFELSSMDYNNEGEKPKFLVDSTKFEGGYEITGTVKIENLYVDVVSETTKTFGIPTGIKNFELKTNYDVVLGLDFKGKLEGEIKFAKFYVPTEVPGLTVEMQASLYCNANGQLSLKLTVTNTTTLGYSDGKLKKVSQSDSVSDKLTFAVEVEPGASITAIPEMLGIKIIDLKIKAGVKFKFETSVEAKAAVDDDSAAVEYIFKLTGNFIYPIVTLEAGSDKSRSLIKLNFSYPVVGEKNAPITAQTVEFFDKEYSLGYVIGDEVETETETEDTEQVESAEFKTAEFGERLDIDTYTIGISAGDVSSIQVTMIPEGYSESDITWESEDPSVATVSGGIVTGVGEGSTQIKVKTSDGKYEAYCAVIVTEQSDFEFHEL